MDYKNRVFKLQQSLSKNRCEALLIDHPVDLFYLTGLQVSTGILLIQPESVIFVLDGRYLEIGKNKSPFPVALLKENLFKTVSFNTINRLGFNSETTSYQAFINLQKLAEKIELVPIPGPLRPLRNIKSADEIEWMRKAADLGTEGYYFLTRHLKEGMTEQEAAFELEFFWKKKGADGLAFDPIIAFGSNSSMPHYRVGTTRLKRGDIVLIDIGVLLNHYHSDMTRTFFFKEADPQLRDIHQIVLSAQLAALKICRPGTTLGELDDAARKYIKEKGYGEQFSHGLGHGVGLEIHEFPSIKRSLEMENIPLEEGMCITIEPGIYLPHKGGVRIEDTVVITADGHINLSAADKNFYVLS